TLLAAGAFIRCGIRRTEDDSGGTAPDPGPVTPDRSQLLADPAGPALRLHRRWRRLLHRRAPGHAQGARFHPADRLGLRRADPARRGRGWRTADAGAIHPVAGG